MSESQAFTKAFAELLWHVVHRPDDVAPQKSALRAATLAAREGARRLDHSAIGHAVSEGVRRNASAPDVAWTAELSARLAAHSVSVLEMGAGVPAGELLALARALASPHASGDEGLAFDSRLVELNLTAVSAVLGRLRFVRHATPVAGMQSVVGRPARTPERTGPRPLPTAGDVEPSARVSAGAAGGEAKDGPGRDAARQIMQSELRRHVHSQSLDEQFALLRGPLGPESAPPIVGELCRAAEAYAADGMWVGVLDVVERLMEREESVDNDDVRRTFAIQYRRLAKSGTLRGLARLLPHRKEARAAIQKFLSRMGAPAADVLLDLLVTSDKAVERSAYRAAIAECPDAIQPLLHLLGDHRWFVVRNAAELLGEMRVQEAEERLILVLSHIDKRCRRSATLALGRIGSKRALHAIAQRLSDDDGGVRLQAALGIGAARNARAVPLILDAYRKETDPEVQVALLAALGRSPTVEAVEQLSDASRAGSLLSRRPQPVRLAAVQALGDAGAVPAARAALRRLLTDRDAEIRGAAAKALGEGAQPLAAAR